MDDFSAYGIAILVMVATAVLQLALSPISAVRKTARGLAPGAAPEADYDDQCYRTHRAYANLSESMGPFVGLTVAAILAGASPFWVNLFAALFLIFRVLMLVVHIGGWGRPDMSLRSFSYVGGWAMCLALGFLAIKAVVSGG